MSEVSNAMAKLAGTQKAIVAVLNENVSPTYRKDSRFRNYFEPDLVRHYFSQSASHIEVLRRLLPDLYEDFHFIQAEPDKELATTPPSMAFSLGQMERLVRDIEQVFEIRANSELAQPKPEALQRVFVSHGHSSDWRTVQAFVEKDIRLPTIELQQQPSEGRTVIEKLFDYATRCDSAVIVMTGDDLSNEDEVRIRENVMHELGLFQGLYGRDRVVLLHEEGVHVPSNLGGVVYVPYPKGNVDAGLHVLHRELKAIYKL